MSQLQNKQQRRRRQRRPPSNKPPRNLVDGALSSVSSLTRVSERFMPLFPPKTRKVLRYATNVNVASTSGIMNSYVFRANDLFDPDVTSTGHQPMGFDQMIVFYNHFHVEKSKITVTAANTASGSLHCGMRVDASPTPLTSSDQIREFGGCSIEVLEAKNAYGSAKTFTFSADIRRLQGISPRTDITADTNLGGDAANSPVEQSYYHLFVYDPNGLSGTVNFDVIIEYDAWFTEPRSATLSLQQPVKSPTESKEPKQPPSGCWVTNSK